jgi:hypothetical protein
MIATAPRRPSLACIVTSSPVSPDRIVLYAPPGWGKTSFAAYLPRPIFLMTPGEDRLKKLIEQQLVPPTAHFPDLAETWADVCGAVAELTREDHDFKTLVLDTGNGVERLAHEQVCESEFSNDWGEQGFNAFARGEKISTNKLWIPFLAQLDQLRKQRGMRIVLVCHTGTRSTKNPDGPDYDKVEPALTRLAWAATSKWADMILYGAFDIQAKKESKIAKAKVTGGRARLLHCSPTAAYEAKNCHRLPPIIRLGEDPSRAFDAFRAAFPKRQEVTNGHGATHDLNGNSPRTLATVGASTATPPDALPASDP